MPRDYTPEVGGSIHAGAVKEAIDAIEIASRIDIPKLRAMRNNEETRAIINDLHENLLIVLGAIITIKNIGEQHKEFRTSNHQESQDAE
jgi:hypothetical protein